ncbi:MAG TPA: ATP-binding protein [Alphaproteobacteria bacterium]|nr:ATP-binding protein [Alphaproteobacteria bacterium]
MRETDGLELGDLSRRDLAILGVAFALSVGVPLAVFMVIWLYTTMDWLAMLTAVAVAFPSAFAVILLGRYLRARGRFHHQAEVFQHLGDTMVSPRVLVGADGKAIWSNSKFRREFPVDLAKPLDELERVLCTDAESRSRFIEARAASRTGSAANFEVVHRHPDGTREIFLLRISPVGQDSPIASWEIENVTSRRMMESVIREEQAKLVDFLENAPVGFYSVDAEGRFLFVNRTLANWLESTPAQIVERQAKLQDFLADGVPAGAEPYRPFLGPPTIQAGEVTLKGRRGNVFEAYISQSVTKGEEGAVRTRSVVRNLTPEREMAEALALSERRFKRFFDEAPLGIARIDASGRVADANAAFRKLLEMTAAEIEGGDILGFVSEDDRSEMRRRLDAVAAGESTAPENIRHATEVRLRGKSREVIASLFITRLDHGNPKGPSDLVLHVFDMTELKQLEMQFAHSQRMQAIGQLAGGIAHDFNNLLTAIIGFSDLLLLRHQPGDTSFGDIMQIKQNSNRAANLVRQLLAFSRQQKLQPKVLNITDALSELSHLLRRLIGENIELKMVHGRDLHLVRVDQGQLEQVIINLAVNARDAMPRGGQVTIRTQNESVTISLTRGAETLAPGDYVRIDVIDTGVGIAKENLTRIFEPFFSTKEVGAGTGLGLSTVYGIVRQTGGFVLVDSEPGAGATFTIYLPRHRGEVRQLSGAIGEEQKRADLTGVGTVLLVEDEDAVRLFSARALRNKGYKVVEAKTGESALELLGNFDGQIDLMITDVVMPQMDGTTLIKTVREQRPELRVICISGYAEESFRNRLDSTAGVHFLPKPFTLEQLAGKVKEVMR